MKGKKMVFAVILSLIVCLLLVPTCAFAETEPTENPATPVEEPAIPETPVEGTEIPQTPVEGGDNPETPVEGGTDPTTPVEGESVPQTPVEGGENPTPPGDGGTNPTPPAAGTVTPDTTGEGGDNTNKGFQVELTYNDKVVKKDGLKGGESFDLAELLRELGIDGEITEAKGNADELFDAVNGEDGWKFNTKMAFGDPYQLVVTVGGVEYVIAVTDMNDPAKVKTEEELQKAINEAYSGQTIIIDGNIEFTTGVKIGSDKTITIDLNGNTLGNMSGKTGVFIITNEGTLTVEDSSSDKTGKMFVQGAYSRGIVNNGTAYLNGGTFTNATHDKNYNGGCRIISNRNIMNINEGFKLVGCGTWAYIDNYNDWSYDGAPEPVLTVNGGTFKAESGKTLLYNDVKGTIIVNGGKFDGCALQNSGTNATINGGEFTNSNGGSLFGIYGTSDPNCKGETIINGGTFTASDNITAKWDNDDGELKGSLTINNGTFTGTLWRDENVSLNVKGGDFSSTKVETYEDESKETKEGSVEDFMVKGATIVEGKDGKFTIIPPAAAPANTIALTSDAPVFKYMVVEGKEQTWTKSGNETLNYVLNADANNLVKVLIDGEEVEFEIDENGEVVISAEVLEKLDAGEYEIEFIFADGSCKTKLFVK